MTVNFNSLNNKPATTSVNDVKFAFELTKNSVFEPKFMKKENNNNIDLSPESIRKAILQIESGLREKIPGYYILTESGRTRAIAEQAAKIQDPQERQAFIDEFVSCIKTEEDAKTMAGIHEGLGDKDAIYAMDKIAHQSEKGAFAVAKESTEVRESILPKVIESTQNLEFGEDVQKKVDAIIIEENYGKYPEKLETIIHQIMSDSKIDDTVKLAAQNIYKLHEENREEAANITKATGNEQAIAAITIVVPETTQVKLTKNTVITEKIADTKYDIKEAIASNDKHSIKTCIDAMGSGEIISLLQENKNTGLINTILECNPSIAVINEINKIIRTSNEVSYKTATKEISFFDVTNQISMVKQAASNNDLGSIKRNFLSLIAKREYDKMEAQTKLA